MYQRSSEMHFMRHHKGNPRLNTPAQELMRHWVGGAMTGLSEEEMEGPERQKGDDVFTSIGRKS